MDRRTGILMRDCKGFLVSKGIILWDDDLVGEAGGGGSIGTTLAGDKEGRGGLLTLTGDEEEGGSRTEVR